MRNRDLGQIEVLGRRLYGKSKASAFVNIYIVTPLSYHIYISYIMYFLHYAVISYLSCLFSYSLFCSVFHTPWRRKFSISL